VATNAIAENFANDATPTILISDDPVREELKGRRRRVGQAGNNNEHKPGSGEFVRIQQIGNNKSEDKLPDAQHILKESRPLHKQLHKQQWREQVLSKGEVRIWKAQDELHLPSVLDGEGKKE